LLVAATAAEARSVFAAAGADIKEMKDRTFVEVYSVRWHRHVRPPPPP
jgi:hypothetical protein